MKRKSKISNDKNTKLEEALTQVKTQVIDLRESASAERKLSDTALVISEDNFDVKGTGEKLNENVAAHGNEWINQGVLDKLNNK